MNNNTENSHLRELEKRISANEKDVLVLKTQYKEMQKNMDEIKETIKEGFQESRKDMKNFTWKIIGAMGTVTVLLVGFLKG